MTAFAQNLPAAVFTKTETAALTKNSLRHPVNDEIYESNTNLLIQAMSCTCKIFNKIMKPTEATEKFGFEPSDVLVRYSYEINEIYESNTNL